MKLVKLALVDKNIYIMVSVLYFDLKAKRCYFLSKYFYN